MSHSYDKTDLRGLLSMLNDLECPEPGPEDQAKARLTVCDRADDATEARDLLAMLGLL